MSKVMEKIQIPKVHLCTSCREKLTPKNVRLEYGHAFCSEDCADRFEEKNQSADYNNLLTVEDY